MVLLKDFLSSIIIKVKNWTDSLTEDFQSSQKCEPRNKSVPRNQHATCLSRTTNLSVTDRQTDRHRGWQIDGKEAIAVSQPVYTGNIHSLNSLINSQLFGELTMNSRNLPDGHQRNICKIVQSVQEITGRLTMVSQQSFLSILTASHDCIALRGS